MYERLKRLYGNGSIDKNGLEKAVTKGWITVEQKKKIIKGE